MSEPTVWGDAYAGDIQKVKSFFKTCADGPDIRDELQGSTALHWAAFGGHLGLVRWLVKDLGSNVNALNNDGCSPFFYACEMCHTGVAQWLVREGGADVNIKDSLYGQTPLHRVCLKGQLGREAYSEELLLWLITKCEADVFAKDFKGNRVEDLGKSRILGTGSKSLLSKRVAFLIEAARNGDDLSSTYHSVKEPIDATIHNESLAVAASMPLPDIGNLKKFGFTDDPESPHFRNSLNIESQRKVTRKSERSMSCVDTTMVKMSVKSRAEKLDRSMSVDYTNDPSQSYVSKNSKFATADQSKPMHVVPNRNIIDSQSNSVDVAIDAIVDQPDFSSKSDNAPKDQSKPANIAYGVHIDQSVQAGTSVDKSEAREISRDVVADQSKIIDYSDRVAIDESIATKVFYGVQVARSKSPKKVVDVTIKQPKLNVLDNVEHPSKAVAEQSGSSRVEIDANAVDQFKKTDLSDEVAIDHSSVTKVLYGVPRTRSKSPKRVVDTTVKEPKSNALDAIEHPNKAVAEQSRSNKVEIDATFNYVNATEKSFVTAIKETSSTVPEQFNQNISSDQLKMDNSSVQIDRQSKSLEASNSGTAVEVKPMNIDNIVPEEQVIEQMVWRHKKRTNARSNRNCKSMFGLDEATLEMKYNISSSEKMHRSLSPSARMVTSHSENLETQRNRPDIIDELKVENEIELSGTDQKQVETVKHREIAHTNQNQVGTVNREKAFRTVHADEIAHDLDSVSYSDTNSSGSDKTNELEFDIHEHVGPGEALSDTEAIYINANELAKSLDVSISKREKSNSVTPNRYKIETISAEEVNEPIDEDIISFIQELLNAKAKGIISADEFTVQKSNMLEMMRITQLNEDIHANDDIRENRRNSVGINSQTPPASPFTKIYSLESSWEVTPPTPPEQPTNNTPKYSKSHPLLTPHHTFGAEVVSPEKEDSVPILGGYSGTGDELANGFDSMDRGAPTEHVSSDSWTNQKAVPIIIHEPSTLAPKVEHHEPILNTTEAPQAIPQDTGNPPATAKATSCKCVIS